jgi:hypothetical protein
MLIVCIGMVFVPLDVKPLTPAVALAVQSKVAPETSEVRVTRAVELPEQIVCVIGLLVTAGNGLTVMVILAQAEL